VTCSGVGNKKSMAWALTTTQQALNQASGSRPKFGTEWTLRTWRVNLVKQIGEDESIST
jgi:hypothetical protein